MQTTATAAATQEPQHARKALGTFIHTPRPPLVPKEAKNAFQRRFQPEDEYGHHKPVTPTAKDARSMLAAIEVYRGSDNDFAELRARFGNWANAAIEIPLKPAELRDLAERLIDAAHDIETNPAKAFVPATAAATAQAAA